MKIFLLIPFLVFTSLISFSQNNNVVDVFLIAGQSNATGTGYIKNLPSDFEIDESVHFFYSTKLGVDGTAMKWGPLRPASNTPNNFGVELSMGTILKQMYPEREIALIKHSLSGSNLYEHWNPGKSKNDTAHFGPEFKKFIQTVETGLKELKDKGFEPKIKAMVWQQGESDATGEAGMDISSNYGANLHHFIKRIRQQLHSPKMLFVYGYVLPVPVKRFTGRDEVRNGQKNVDQNSGHKLALKRAFVVETDDLPLRCDEPDSPLPDDKLHFNTFGVIELGERFANKINQKLK